MARLNHLLFHTNYGCIHFSTAPPLHFATQYVKQSTIRINMLYCCFLLDMKFYFYFFWSQGWAAVCCTHAHVCEFWAYWAEQLANWRWFLREWVTFNLASSPFLSSLISIDSSSSLIFAQQLPTDCVIFIAAYTWPRSHNRLNFLRHVFQHSTTQRASETYQCFPAWNTLAWLSLNFKSFIHELTAIQTLLCENFLHLSIVFVF